VLAIYIGPRGIAATVQKSNIHALVFKYIIGYAKVFGTMHVFKKIKKASKPYLQWCRLTCLSTNLMMTSRIRL